MLDIRALDTLARELVNFVSNATPASVRGAGIILSRRTTRGHSQSLPSQRPVLLSQPSQRSVKMLQLEVGSCAIVTAFGGIRG
jgi:hypothetical protein